MMVASQGLRNVMLAHDNKRGTVGEGPFFVRPIRKKFQGELEC